MGIRSHEEKISDQAYDFANDREKKRARNRVIASVAVPILFVLGGVGGVVAQRAGLIGGSNPNEGKRPAGIAGPSTPGSDGEQNPAVIGSPTTYPTPSITPSPSASPTSEATATPTGGIEAPTDLESLPRETFEQADLGVWFHPIYNLGLYNSDNTLGQMSWYHTMRLQTEEGGEFRGFNGNDGRFVFRVDETHSDMAFEVSTTNQYFDQFMAGSNAANSAVNVRTLPNTDVEIYDPRTGEVVGTQRTSQGGDLTIIEPSNGLYGIRVVVDDPAATFEVQVWLGPYDRSHNINTFDASSLGQ